MTSLASLCSVLIHWQNLYHCMQDNTSTHLCTQDIHKPLNHLELIEFWCILRGDKTTYTTRHFRWDSYPSPLACAGRCQVCLQRPQSQHSCCRDSRMGRQSPRRNTFQHHHVILIWIGCSTQQVLVWEKPQGHEQLVLRFDCWDFPEEVTGSALAL